MVVWRLSKVGFWFVEQLISAYQSHHLSQGETKEVSQDNAALLFVCRSAFTTQSVTRCRIGFIRKCFKLFVPQMVEGFWVGIIKEIEHKCPQAPWATCTWTGTTAHCPFNSFHRKFSSFSCRWFQFGLGYIVVRITAIHSAMRIAHCAVCVPTNWTNWYIA